MKIKNLILSLILILSIGVSNTMPTYAVGEFDPEKGAAFNEIRDEVLSRTRDFNANIELSNKVFNDFKAKNSDLYSAYLDLFRKGEGDCKTAAYAISKLFTDKGIKNRVLRLTYTNGVVHAVVCYEKDECVEGETGFGIVDFFDIKNYEQQAINSEEIECLIACSKETIFMWDASIYFENKNYIANIEAYPLHSSNRDDAWLFPVSINLPDNYGGWSELSTYLKEAGIKLCANERVLKKTKFDEIIGEFNEKFKSPEYNSEKGRERIIVEISERLKEVGIENEIIDVSEHFNFKNKIIRYKDDFMNSEEGIYGIIDFSFAKRIREIDNSARALKIATGLVRGIYAEKGYHEIIDVLSIFGHF